MMNFTRRTALGLLGATALAVSGTFAQAQSNAPITIVVPYGAGGTVDSIMRLLAESMTQTMGRPVLVENKPGGNGIVASQYVARAKNDGLTLLAAGTGPVSLNVMLRKDLPFKLEDFAPVSLISDGPLTVTVNADLGVNDIAGLVALAKERGTPLRFGTFGPGSVSQLFGLMLTRDLGIPLTDVSYRNTPSELVDLLAGQTEFSVSSPIGVLPNVEAGKLKILALASDERSAQLPDVPTLKEAGYPELSASFWTGLLAPAGTPVEMIDAVNKAVNTALETDKVKERMANEVQRIQGGGPEKMAERLEEDKKSWGAVISANSISLD